MKSCCRGIIRQWSHSIEESLSRVVEPRSRRDVQQESRTIAESYSGSCAAGDPGSSKAAQQQNGAAAESCNKGVFGSKGVLPQENLAVLYTRRIAAMQQGNRSAGHMCSNGVVQEREAASTMKACSSRDM